MLNFKIYPARNFLRLYNIHKYCILLEKGGAQYGSGILLISFGNEVHPARMLNLNSFATQCYKEYSNKFTQYVNPVKSPQWRPWGTTQYINMDTIKEFFLKHESKIVLFIGFCLISGISYEFGVLQGQKWQQEPLIIERPIETPKEGVSSSNEASVVPSNVSSSVLPAKAPTSISATDCTYVGSKNSNKFYLPTCSYAKRVKPENLVCFKSAEQAIGQGRTESKCASSK